MTDKLDKATRSRIMSHVRGKDTVPELKLRKGLFARGLRYRLHCSNLPGKPDVVFPKYKSVIFVNGCYWHGHNCPRFKMPSSNVEYWCKKIDRNRSNDKRNINELNEIGWRTLTIWECELKLDLCKTLDKAEKWLKLASHRTI